MMRATSERRRSEPRGRVFNGPGSARPKTPVRSIELDADDPAAIMCVECGAYVKRLANDRPAAHAAGGIPTSVRWGRYKCEGSGRE